MAKRSSQSTAKSTNGTSDKHQRILDAAIEVIAEHGFFHSRVAEIADRAGVADGTRVQVRSRRGVVEATAFVTSVVQPGQVFLPMHFPGVNRLTFPSFDPHSRQPSYKACAVSVSPLPPAR